MAVCLGLWSNTFSFLIGGWPGVPYPEPFVKPLENFEMKKTLVAVAALAAFAGAHAEVSITGVVEAGILMPAKGNNAFASGGNGGSEITFGVGEDLGNGLKANASITYINKPFVTSAGGAPGTTYDDDDAATNAISSYNSYIGLSNEIGSLKLGHQFTPAFFVVNSGDPFGQAGGTYNLATNTAATALTSGSVTAAGSFSGVGVAYQTNVANTVNSYSLTYSTGALNVGYAAQTNAAANQTFIAGNYDFGIAKLYLLSKTETAKKAATSVGVTAPVGPVVVGYSVSARGSDKQNSNFGVTYPLSKRTSVAWVNYNGGGQTTTTGAAVGTGNFVGITHKF